MYDVGLHQQKVVFCIDRAGITGNDGPSHHGVLDLVLLSKVPGMTILAPSSYEEVGVMLHDALELATGPVAIRWPNMLAPSVSPDEVGHGFRARKVRDGDDACVLAVGKMLGPALEAADALAAEGVAATVWDVRVVKPLDPEMLEDAAHHPVVITVEDGMREGGAGTTIVDALGVLCGDGRPAPRVRVLGVPVTFVPHGKPDAILSALGLDATGIAGEVRQALSFSAH
jgi:1-deoxy-D-xylulose-5-phosphate synthase